MKERLQTTDLKEPLVKHHTNNLNAYNLYLKGLYYWNKWNPSSVKKAIKIFDEAIVKEPDFALPYSGLANCYTYLGAMGVQKPKEAFPKARKAAEKALALDSSRVESLISIALVKFFHDWDWTGAYRDYKYLLDNYSGYAGVHHTYAFYLMSCGEYQEVVREMEQALLLDPLSLPINLYLGSAYALVGRYQDAINQINKTLELDPNFKTAYYELGFTYMLKGDLPKALDIFKNMYENSSNEIFCTAYLAYAYAMNSEMEKAKELLDELHEKADLEKQVSLYFDFAVIYAGIGNEETAMDYLEKAYEERLGGLVFIRTSPLYKHLNENKRFKELLNKMNLVVK